MDISTAQRLLLEHRGWVQGPHEGVLLCTVVNCTEVEIAAQQREGWELVALFRGKTPEPASSPGGLPNRAVFERPLPAFYSAPAPWHEGGNWAWLPALVLAADEQAIGKFMGVGGHGSPYVVRSFRCRCGQADTRVFEDVQRERVIVVCGACGLVSNAFSLEAFALPEPRTLEEAPWQKLLCRCGGDHHTLHYGIEYPSDSRDGADFTWLALVTQCARCGSLAETCSKETQ